MGTQPNVLSDQMDQLVVGLSYHSLTSKSTYFRQHYLRNGFAIDVMACLPYDLLNIFDTWFKGSAASAAEQNDLEWSNANVFSILKVMRLFRLGRVARALHREGAAIQSSLDGK